MMNIIKDFFGFEKPVDLEQLIAQGATIMDVRTKEEYAEGHLKGSINVPLNALISRLSKIKIDKPVITCCALGMGSIAAKRLLKSNGFSQVYNAGNWASLKKYVG